MTETQTTSGSATDLPHASPDAPTGAGPADVDTSIDSTTPGVSAGVWPDPEAIVSNGADPWVTQGTQEGGFVDDPDAEPVSTTPDLSGIRVPNVSAGAVSGLAHTPIGADANEAAAFNDGLADLQAGEWDEDAWVAWVKAGRTSEEAQDRADVTYESKPDSYTEDEDTALAARLMAAVYGDDPDAHDAEGMSVPDVTPEPTDDAPDSTITEDGTIQRDVTQGGGGGTEGTEDPASAPAEGDATGDGDDPEK